MCRRRASVSMGHIRLTEKPIRINYGNLVESGANVFTTTPVPVPGVPSIAITRGDTKGIGLEIMKVYSEMDEPDNEAGQRNTLTVEISKGAAPAAQRGMANRLTVWRRRRIVDNLQTTAVGETVTNLEDSRWDDLTDGDGNGELVLDSEMHLSVQGTGNAAAKNSGGGYMLCHLVEFDSNEVVFELLETSS